MASLLLEPTLPGTPAATTLLRPTPRPASSPHPRLHHTPLQPCCRHHSSTHTSGATPGTPDGNFPASANPKTCLCTPNCPSFPFHVIMAICNQPSTTAHHPALQRQLICFGQPQAMPHHPNPNFVRPFHHAMGIFHLPSRAAHHLAHQRQPLYFFYLHQLPTS